MGSRFFPTLDILFVVRGDLSPLSRVEITGVTEEWWWPALPRLLVGSSETP
jgi:hypothetical protein